MVGSDGGTPPGDAVRRTRRDSTQASLVCEDLAQNDDVAQLIRSVGPTVVICVLLDGPQLTSRWAARYASVLADDPGSAVLTLSLPRHGGALTTARPGSFSGHRVVEGFQHGSPRDSARARRTRRPADGHAWIVRLGEAPTAAGRSTTARPAVTRPSIKFGRRALAQNHARHAPPRRLRTFWKPTSSPFSRRGQRVCPKPRPTHPSASTLCWPRHTEARHGEPRSGSRNHPPDSPTRWNRSAEWFAPLRSHPAHRYSTECSRQLSKDHPDEGRLDGLVRHTLLAMLEERATRQSTQAHMAR